MNAGYGLPRSKDGFMRSIAVSSTSLPPEGWVGVVKSAESWRGHVLVAKMTNGQLVSVADSVGVGRVLPPSVFQGYI